MEISRVFWFIFPTLCFSLFTLIPKTEADLTFLWVYCPIKTTYAPNSSISYNFTSPPSSSPASCRRPKNLCLCRGDVSATISQNCLAFAFGDAPKQCPRSKQVTIWYDECMLRYSDQPIPSVLDQSYSKILTSPGNVTDTESFNHVLGEVMDDIATRASSGGSDLKFAVGESNLSVPEKLYGLAQCMPDLTNTDCYSCLRSCISAFRTSCNGSRGARVLYPSCNIRYEMYPFYNPTAVPISPTPPPVLSPAPRPSTTTSSPGYVTRWQGACSEEAVKNIGPRTIRVEE